MGRNETVLKIRVPKRQFKRYEVVNNRVINIDLRCIRQNNSVVNEYPQRMKFATPELMKTKCEEYFASCDGVIYNKAGQMVMNKDGTPLITQIKPYTISGLLLYLEMGRENLHRYEIGDFDLKGYPRKNEYVPMQYSDVVKWARRKIENYAEERLYDRDGHNGGRYVLDCAFGWSTQKERAEIKSMQDTIALRREDQRMKREMLDSDEEEETTIIIKRASKDEDDE